LRLEAVLAERGDLSLEQAAMVRSLCSSGNGVEVVVGVPGSGKTFALDAARRAWQSSGYRVYGAALAAEATAQLEAGSGISSVTLDRLLYELAAPPHLSHYSLDPRSVVVVDEASMVDTRRLVRLLEIAGRAGAKVVLTGDDRQLPNHHTFGRTCGRWCLKFTSSRRVAPGRRCRRGSTALFCGRCRTSR
jgi:DNA transposition AAA+ family ATPase